MRTEHHPPHIGRQRGSSLLFTLMALVIMGFAAVALTRSVDTGTLIMGNLSFKQDTLLASNSGAEQAITWLQANINSADLNADQPNRGYYASSLDRLDPTGGNTSATDKRPLINWDGNCLGLDASKYETCEVLPFTGAAVNGNQVQWIITRLCDATGVPAGANLCVRPATVSTSTTSERGELNPGGRISRATTSPFYRVIVRIEGARGTATVTETMVHF